MASNEQRFERMVTAFSADLYRFAYRLCYQRDLAEDLVQETFMRAWRRLDALRDETKAKGWLFTTLRREHARQYERYRPQFEEMDPDLVAHQPGGREAELWSLRRELMKLPVNYREVLLLQVIGGYSGNEIADLLDLPRATVNTRLFRARQKLRKQHEGGPATHVEGTDAK